MFETTKAFRGFAAPDLVAARTFHADTLGLRVTEEDTGPLLSVHLGNGPATMIHATPDHLPATHTGNIVPVLQEA